MSQIFVFNPNEDVQCESVEADDSGEDEERRYPLLTTSTINGDEENIEDFNEIVNHSTINIIGMEDESTLGEYRQKHNSETWSRPPLGYSTGQL